MEVYDFGLTLETFLALATRLKGQIGQAGDLLDADDFAQLRTFHASELGMQLDSALGADSASTIHGLSGTHRAKIRLQFILTHLMLPTIYGSLYGRAMDPEEERGLRERADESLAQLLNRPQQFGLDFAGEDGDHSTVYPEFEQQTTLYDKFRAPGTSLTKRW